jgi:hypothetical protein
VIILLALSSGNDLARKGSSRQMLLHQGVAAFDKALDRFPGLPGAGRFATAICLTAHGTRSSLGWGIVGQMARDATASRVGGSFRSAGGEDG